MGSGSESLFLPFFKESLNLSAFAVLTIDKVKSSPLFVDCEAVLFNPSCNEDIPEVGLSTARMLAHITYLSEESMDDKFGRELQETGHYSFDFKGDFAVESYLRYQGNRFVGRFDANSYLYITRAIDYFDVSEKAEGNLSKALENVTMPFMMVSFTSDWLFPPSQSQDVVKAMLQNGTNITYCNIESSYGHDAFLLEVETLGDLLENFIKNAYIEVRNG